MPDPGPCPSARDLDEFASGKLLPAQRAMLDEHLARCVACSKLVAALLASDPPPPTNSPGEAAGDSPGDAPGSEDGLLAEAPRYRLLRLIGSGGMGEVYEAEEVRSGRHVALKLSHEPNSTRASELVRRFSREAQIAAQLEHPNIVPVFDIGTFPDGFAYYTQRLIQGQSLGVAIAACKTLHERIALIRHFRELCDAIAYAHRRGIVHRDLKPGNTIIGTSGETWVIDWGLARILRAPLTANAGVAPTSGGQDSVASASARPAWADGLISDPALTVIGTSMGTPAYMSPEQARGEVSRVDEKSDVWSLGAVLYELLVGRPPFAGLDVEEVLVRLRDGQGPILPSGLSSEAPPELVAIARKALSPRREARYASAVALADDVHAWMISARVSAYSYSPVERTVRWVRRYRVFSTILAVGLLAAAGWSFSLRASNREFAHERAEDLLRRAKTSARVLQWDRAAIYFASMLEFEERADARLGLAVTGLASARPIWKQPAQSGAIRALAFADPGTLVSAGENGGALAFDRETGAQVSRRQFPGPVTAMAACEGGQVALATGASATVWRPRKNQLGPQLAHPGAVAGVALSEDCALLATAANDGVRVFRLPEGELATRFGADQAANDVAFLRGRRLIWASQEGLHEAPDALEALEGPAPAEIKQGVRRLSASPSTGRLLAQLHDGSLASFDLSRLGAAVFSPGVRTNRFSGVIDTVTENAGLLFPGGQDVLVIRIDNAVGFSDFDTGVPYSNLEGLGRGLHAASISADDRWMATGGEDGLLRVYDLLDVRKNAGQRVRGGTTPTDVAWSPDGALLATSEEDGSIRLWDERSGRPRAAWSKHHGAARTLQFSPDGSKLASGGADGVRVFWVATGVELGIPGGPSVRALTWISDVAIATARDDGAVAVRGLDGTEKILHREHRGAVRGLAISPDGAVLASAGMDGALALFDLRAGRVVHKVAAHGEVLALAWARDGRKLATAGQDREVRLWDASSLALLEQKQGYDTAKIVSLDFEPASRSAPSPGALLVATDQGQLAFVEPHDTRGMFSFYSWTAAAMVAARLSPDGRRIALLTAEGFLRVAPLDGPRKGNALQRLMRHYKYRAEQGDVIRDEGAMTPPALGRKSAAVDTTDGRVKGLE